MTTIPLIRHGVPLVLFAILALMTVNAIPRSGFNTGWPPDTSSEPARIQIGELAIAPGDAFKGRSLALLEMATPGQIQWGTHYSTILYQQYRQAFGYDFVNDAAAAGVPTTNEYGHWISPGMLALLAAGFYDPSDSVNRAAQMPRVYRAGFARLMGVGLVVSDAPIPGEQQLYAGSANGHPLYLHRVANPNLGQYSPTRTVVATSAAAILDQLQAQHFDGAGTAVVEQPIETPLVAATGVTVRLEKGPFIAVTASSAGTSLLVLPFDWSTCLRASGTGLVGLVPVNLAQVGLLIEGNAAIRIAYQFGLFAGSACRKADFDRARELDIEGAALGRLFADVRQ